MLPLQDSPQPGHDFRAVERPDQIVVGPVVEDPDGAAHGILPGQDQDGRDRRPRPEFGDDPLGAVRGEADIDQGHVEILAGGEIEGRRYACHRSHLQTQASQHQLDIEPLHRVDQKDLLSVDRHVVPPRRDESLSL